MTKWWPKIVLMAATAAVAQVPLHNPSLPTIPVTIQGHPYTFMLDTGTTMSSIDPRVVAQLKMPVASSYTTMTGVGSTQTLRDATVSGLIIDGHNVQDTEFVVLDASGWARRGVNIDGVLGEDILNSFDVLIDYDRGTVTLDDDEKLRNALKGERVSLHGDHGLLIVEAALSDRSGKTRLCLDSGANVPFLSHKKGADLSFGGQFRAVTVYDGRKQSVYNLDPQVVSLGSLKLPSLQFFTATEIQKDIERMPYDGVLPLRLFRQVFISRISPDGRYAIFRD
jgi:hypothetical protein